MPAPHHLEDTTLVALELTSPDMTMLSQRRVSGLITEHGGLWSHTAILARSLEIPMLTGVHHAAELLMDGEAVVLDGHYEIGRASCRGRVKLAVDGAAV